MTELLGSHLKRIGSIPSLSWESCCGMESSCTALSFMCQGLLMVTGTQTLGSGLRAYLQLVEQQTQSCCEMEWQLYTWKRHSTSEQGYRTWAIKYLSFSWYFKRKPVPKKDTVLCPTSTQYKDKKRGSFFFFFFNKT